MVDKGKKVASDCMEKVKELDRQHHLKEQVQQFASWSLQTTIEFTRRHRFIERGVEVVGRGVELLMENILPNRISSSSTPPEDSQANQTAGTS